MKQMYRIFISCPGTKGKEYTRYGEESYVRAGAEALVRRQLGLKDPREIEKTSIPAFYEKVEDISSHPGVVIAITPVQDKEFLCVAILRSDDLTFHDRKIMAGNFSLARQKMIGFLKSRGANPTDYGVSIEDLLTGEQVIE